MSNSFYGGKRGFGINIENNKKSVDGLFYKVGTPQDTEDADSIYGAIARKEIKYGDYVILSESNDGNEKGNMYRVTNQDLTLVGNIVGPQGPQGENIETHTGGGVSYIPQGDNTLTLINDDFGYAPGFGQIIGGVSNTIRSSILLDGVSINTIPSNVYSNFRGPGSYYKIKNLIDADNQGLDFVSVYRGGNYLPPAIYISKKGNSNRTIYICKYQGNTIAQSQIYLRDGTKDFSGLIVIFPQFNDDSTYTENGPWELILWPCPSGYNCFGFILQTPGVGFEAHEDDAENGYIAPQTQEELEELGFFNIWQVGANEPSTGNIPSSSWKICGGQFAQGRNVVSGYADNGRIATWEPTGYNTTPTAYSVRSTVTSLATPSSVICPNLRESRRTQFNRYFSHKFDFFTSSALMQKSTLRAVPSYIYYKEDGKIGSSDDYYIKYITSYTLYLNKEFLCYNPHTEEYMPILKISGNINNGFRLKQLE